MSQDKLFSDEEVIQRDWNKRFPCPKCEVGKLEYSQTENFSYISCFKCHWTWRRECDFQEEQELKGRYGGGKADS